MLVFKSSFKSDFKFNFKFDFNFNFKFGFKFNCKFIFKFNSTVEFENEVTVEQARAAIESAPGAVLIDDRIKNYYPMPIEFSGQDDVGVGRFRKDLGFNNALSLFCCGDQLLKGAALNAVQIAELL